MAALIKALAKSIGPKLAIGLALGGGAWAAMHCLLYTSPSPRDS